MTTINEVELALSKLEGIAHIGGRFSINTSKIITGDKFDIPKVDCKHCGQMQFPHSLLDKWNCIN